MTTIVFIDGETTGLKPDQNAVIQVGGLVEVDGQLVEQFDVRCRPHAGSTVNPRALEVNGVAAEMLDELPDPAEARAQLDEVLSRWVPPGYDRLWFCAYNAAFDWDFIRLWWRRHGGRAFSRLFWHPRLCAMQRAAVRLRHERAYMPNFKLVTVAQRLGIQVTEDVAHDALIDAQLAHAVWHLSGDAHVPQAAYTAGP